MTRRSDLPKRKLLLFIILLIGISILTFSNSLKNDFLMDDYGLILENAKFHNLSLVHYQFFPSLHMHVEDGKYQEPAYYRPIAHILPMIAYFLFKENVFYYHLMNLVLFFLGCLSIFFLINHMFQDLRLSALTAILFCIHPLNGIMVNYVSASVFAVQIILMSLSVTMVLKSTEGKKWLHTTLGLIFYLLSCLCHETAYILPLFLISTLWIIKKLSFRKSILTVIPFFLITIFLFLIRFKMASYQPSLVHKLVVSMVDPLQYLASFTKLICWYISRIFYPENVVIKWATPAVEVNVSLWVMIFFVLFGIVVLSVMKRKKHSHWALAITWLVIGFIPVSVGCTFQIKYGFIIEPHWLFFPSIGLFYMIARSLLLLDEKSELLSKILFCFIFTFLIMQSRYMNTLWGNEQKYAHYWHSQAPVLKGPIFYIATTYMNEGNYAKARSYYEKALEGSKLDWEIYNNLGLMAFYEKDYSTAMAYFQNALSVDPQASAVHNNIGVVYLNQQEWIKAEEYFNKAVQWNNFSLKSRLNLARVYIYQQRWQDAINLCTINLSINPYHEETYFNLVEIHILTDDQRQVKELLARLRNEKRWSASMFMKLGDLFSKKNYLKIAISLYLEALNRDVSMKEAYLNLGKALGNLGQYNEAIIVWQSGLKLFPESHEMENLIKKASQFEGKKAL